MNEKHRGDAVPYRGIWLGIGVLFFVAILAIPRIMGMDWDGFDHLAWGLLLCAPIFLWMLVARATDNRSVMVGAAIGLVGTTIMFWVNLAVGIVGQEGNAADLLFVAVPAVGLVVAAVGRFRPPAIAKGLAGMAMLQSGVAILAFARGWEPATMFSAGLAALWALAAWLCARPHQRGRHPD